MKKKAISVITMCIAGTFILTSSVIVAVASESSEVNTDKIGVTVESVEGQTEVSSPEVVEEPNVQETVIEEPDELDWETDQIAALSGILTGVEDKTYDVSTACKYDIHMSVTFNKDIVAGVLFNTANIDFATPGEYNVTYQVYFNRDALINYMSENNIDTGNFPGLSEAAANRIKVTVNGKVTVGEAEVAETTDEEIAYEETAEEEVPKEEIYEEEVSYDEDYYEEYSYDDSSYSESSNSESSNSGSSSEETVESESSSDGTFTTTVLDCNDPSHGYTGVFDEVTGDLLYKIDEW